MRSHASSFYLSTRLLPSAKRFAIEAFYGFCRFTDDAADKEGLMLEQRVSTMRTIRADIERIYRNEPFGKCPWYAALRATFACFPVDIRDAFELIDGCESDIYGVDIRSIDDLERYAAAVAGTVGRATIAILGATDANSLVRAEKLGIAMQFTNVLRDVEEDRQLGRNYLPTPQFPDASLAEIMTIVARRARMYYDQSQPLLARVPNDGSRVAVVLARRLYESILDCIDARQYDSTLGRAYVPLRRKVGLAMRSIFDAYAGFTTIK